jgi:hypothetical protein
MADNIIQFQAGREAAMSGERRDARRNADWLEGYDQVADEVTRATKPAYHIDPRNPRCTLHEDAIQAAFIRIMALKAPGVIIAAMPNAGKRTRWEAMQRKREGMVAGFPDIIALYDGGVCLIEFKSGTGVLRKPQAAMLDRLASQGIQCGVFRSAASAVAFLQGHWPAAFRH